MSSLFTKFRETRSKYGTLYALARLRNFLMATLRLLLRSRGVLSHNKTVGESGNKARRDRIIVVGNGPSLNKLPMHLLEGEDVFVSNNFHLMFPRIAWRPRFMAISDAYVLIESHTKVIEHAESYERIYVPAMHASNVDSFKIYKKLKNSYFFNVMPIPKVRDLAYVPINKTVTNFMLGIGARLGYREVLFIGLDLSYPSVNDYDQSKRIIQSQRDDKDHFSPEYFNKGKHFHAPEVDEMRNQIRLTIERLDGISFKNIGVGGRLDFIERAALRSALVIDHETEISLLRRHLRYRLPLLMPNANHDALTEEIIERLLEFSTSPDVPQTAPKGISFHPTGHESAKMPGEIIAVDALGFDIRANYP
ncbi:hypothetical protein [Pararhizobium sp. A13]|uniref:hypothetical protein n=1 Tax=Pararhizobium sp. A13 TaxID=3133975 RepID=UPI00311AC918